MVASAGPASQPTTQPQGPDLRVELIPVVDPAELLRIHLTVHSFPDTRPEPATAQFLLLDGQTIVFAGPSSTAGSDLIGFATVRAVPVADP